MSNKIERALEVIRHALACFCEDSISQDRKAQAQVDRAYRTIFLTLKNGGKLGETKHDPA